MFRTIALRAALCLLLASASGCVVVAAHEREYLADPTMAAQPDPLEARSRRKVHASREGAGGGGGTRSGGGCACGN